MAILYKLYKMVRTFKDGRADKANNHWFARAITTETVGIDKLSEMIQARCTLTKVDIKACVESFIETIREQILDSKAVKLDGLGTFKIGLKCVGAETVADFSANTNIVGSRVIFLPTHTIDHNSGKHDVHLLRGIKFKETAKNDVVKE